MAKKTAPSAARSSITLDRAIRLYRLLRLLSKGPQKRETLVRQLGLDVRSFYRDLELLRAAGIAVALDKHVYVLDQPFAKARDLLPFHDPGLTLGEALKLARGRTAVHSKLHAQIERILARG